MASVGIFAGSQDNHMGEFMGKKYEVGLFMGRFQPAHRGHMFTITEALRLCDTLFVGIGTTEESGTDKNPLNVEERREILEAAMKGEGINMNRIKIIPIPDFPSDEDWFKYIKKNCPKLSVMFTDNPWCIGICERENVSVETPLLERETISATNFRKAIREDGDWRSFASKGAIQVIEKYIPKIKKALTDNKKKIPS